MVLRAAARYNLLIRWLPDRLAEQNFNIGEPPAKASPWVGVLMGHLQKLRQSLEHTQGLSPANTDEVAIAQSSFGACQSCAGCQSRSYAPQMLRKCPQKHKEDMIHADSRLDRLFSGF